jgi:hypothetical protein
MRVIIGTKFCREKRQFSSNYLGFSKVYACFSCFYYSMLLDDAVTQWTIYFVTTTFVPEHRQQKERKKEKKERRKRKQEKRKKT